MYEDVPSPRARVSFGGSTLTLEVEANTNPAARKVVIGVEEFASCRFRRGILADRLHLRTQSLAALGGVPGAFQDVMVLRFAKRDRGDAESLAGRIVSAMSDRPG